ncbi:hypothetical protein DVH24_036832 [Malus domestica]|uniref:Uncharacterized protein n=1 Tax=Malus domestica TaxID=3750 RepID=A0A498IM09_MALDO|nr:hypothetical protein DVH24_036832 [Malus domestica]
MELANSVFRLKAISKDSFRRLNRTFPMLDLLHELERSRNWASLHVADHSCSHYRIIMTMSSYGQALSILYYLRYMNVYSSMASSPLPFLFWIKHFITDHPGLSSHANNSMNDDFRIFMNNKLQLLDSCSIIPDNSFDDYQAQAKHSATYILWLIKLKTENLKALLNKACPERSSTWDSLQKSIETNYNLMIECRENAVESLFSLSNLANRVGPPVHPPHQRSSALLKIIRQKAIVI